MTIEFADSVNELPGRRDLATRSVGEAVDFKTAHKVQNFLLERSDAKLGGQVFDAGLTISTTTALPDRTPCGIVDRKIASDNVTIAVALYATDALIDVQVRNAATGTLLATISPSSSGTAWSIASTNVAYTSVTDDGTLTGTPSLLYCTVTGDPTTASDGVLYEYSVYGDIDLAAADVPTGI